MAPKPPHLPAPMNTSVLYDAATTLFPHLPSVVSMDTMTNLGLRVGDLDVLYVQEGQALDHLQATRFYVGIDYQGLLSNQGRYAFAVFPTWTGLSLSWMDAARLAQIHHASLGDSAPNLWSMQPSHLYHRLVGAALPLEQLRMVSQQAKGSADGMCDLFHTTYAALLSTQGAHALRNTIVLARTEAADLARALVASWEPSPLAPLRAPNPVVQGAHGDQRPAPADSLHGLRPDNPLFQDALLHLAAHPSYHDPLLCSLLDAAVPDLFFQGGHQQMAAAALRMEVCLRGADALPPFLHPVAAPVEDPLM